MPNIRLLEADGANIRLRPIHVNRNHNVRLYPAAVTLPGDITLGTIYPFRDNSGSFGKDLFEFDGSAWMRPRAYYWTGSEWAPAVLFYFVAGRWDQINTTGLEM